MKQSTCFKRDGAIHNLLQGPLKAVDVIKYLGSNISSTEIDVNIHFYMLIYVYVDVYVHISIYGFVNVYIYIYIYI